MTPGYPAVPVDLPNEKAHRRLIATSLNNQGQGKLNAVTSVTLTVSGTTTTLTDARIGANTFIGFSPMTAHAASAVTSLYVSAQKKGSATLTHASSANADQTFAVLLIG